MPKNFNLILVAILGIALTTSCGSKRQAASTLSYSMLCQDESHDDEEYFRVLGIGEHPSSHTARELARQDALNVLANKLSNSANNTVAIGECAEIVCEKVIKSSSGHYKVFIALQCSKDNVKIDEIKNSSIETKNSNSLNK